MPLYNPAVTSGEWQPADLGLLAWNVDPFLAGTQASAVNGTIYMLQLPLRTAQTITNLAVYLGTGATTATASQNFLALVDSTGTIQGSTAAGAIDTQTQSAGWLSHAMQATYNAPAGIYTVAVLLNAATPAKFANLGIVSTSGANAGRTGAQLRFSTNGTGATALPGSFTLASNSTSGAILGSVGVS